MKCQLPIISLFLMAYCGLDTFAQGLSDSGVLADWFDETRNALAIAAIIGAGVGAWKYRDWHLQHVKSAPMWGAFIAIALTAAIAFFVLWLSQLPQPVSTCLDASAISPNPFAASEANATCRDERIKLGMGAEHFVPSAWVGNRNAALVMVCFWALLGFYVVATMLRRLWANRQKLGSRSAFGNEQRRQT